MALVIADRVKETSTTTGTGTLTLGGAATGYQAFGTAIGSGNTCYYAITLDSAWEVGIGTVGTGTLSRDSVLASSNSNSLVNFGAGTKDVFVTHPASAIASLVSGPASVVAGRIATFDGTSGKAIQDSGKSLPSGTVVGTTDAQTLTGKTIAYADNTLTGVQPTLVSGTSIKTINSTSILGSGDIATGDVVGPASSTSGNVATFNGVTGKIIQDGGKALPTGTIVGTSDSQTLTNKTLTAPVISTISNTGTLTLPTSTDTLVGRATTDTLTNKTLTDPAIIGTILEDIFTITDGEAFEIDPGNGSIQLITLGASRTPKATNFTNGESVTLMVDDDTAYTLTWTDATFGGSGVVWKTDSGSAPTLNTSGYTVIVLWKVGGQVYGARVGNA